MSTRDRRVLAVIAVLAVLVGGWLLVIQPKRTQAAKLGRQIATARQALQSANAQASAALADEHAYASNYAEVARLGEAVPADDDTASLIVQLQSAASRSSVDFLSLQLSANGASAPASTTPSPSSSSSGKSSTTTGAATAAPVAALPPGAAIGPAGFPTMPFTFSFEGNFFHLADFLGRVERFVTTTSRRISVSGRLMTLNSISFAPGASGFPQISATITATTYLLPANEGLSAGGTSSAPATTTSTQSTSGATGASSAAPAAISAPTP